MSPKLHYGKEQHDAHRTNTRRKEQKNKRKGRRTRTIILNLYGWTAHALGERNVWPNNVRLKANAHPSTSTFIY